MLSVLTFFNVSYGQAIFQRDIKPLTVLISIDGFQSDYLKRGFSPNLQRLARQGVLAKALIPVFPSLTFPNHVSLMTGRYPDHHGIVNNTMNDPSVEQRFSLGVRDAVENPFWWSEVVPLWVTAMQQNKIVATLFWPGSDVSIGGVRPNKWLPYDHDMTPEARVKTLLSWLDQPSAKRADFATLYFSDVDSAGHQMGPDSKEVDDAINKVDEAIGQFVQGLDRLGLLAHTTFVVTSDHGMARVNIKSGIIHGAPLVRDFPQAKWEWAGPTSGIRLNGASKEAVLLSLAAEKNMQCWSKENVPAQFHFGKHRRIPDIVCLADVGFVLSPKLPYIGPVGLHGYDPQHPSMHGLLIVSGYRIAPRLLGDVKSLDIYPLLAELIDVQPAMHDGSRSLVDHILNDQ